MDESGNGCGKEQTRPVCSKALGNSATCVSDIPVDIWDGRVPKEACGWSAVAVGTTSISTLCGRRSGRGSRRPFSTASLVFVAPFFPPVVRCVLAFCLLKRGAGAKPLEAPEATYLTFVVPSSRASLLSHMRRRRSGLYARSQKRKPLSTHRMPLISCRRTRVGLRLKRARYFDILGISRGEKSHCCRRGSFARGRARPNHHFPLPTSSNTAVTQADEKA